MINFQKYTLANGLRLIVHQDFSTPIASVCMTYAVGTKDEAPERTGFAHLFEHLMFGGSAHAPLFDEFVQNAGGENNAFTNQDMTVYYDLVPLENIDVALWLEADRMENLVLNQKALDIQRRVVVEEFKETCLEEPFGDIWHHIGPLAYQRHPYRVPTIGETFKHIEEASLEDVKAFFTNYYCPNNAILSISANLPPEAVLAKVQKWFGHIAKGPARRRAIPQELPQEDYRQLEVQGEVSVDAIFMVFHSAARHDMGFYYDDILSDILGDGEASMLFKELTKKQSIFADADAYVTGTIDPGLFVIEGKLAEGVSCEEAEQAVWELLDQLKEMPLNKKELQKIQNRIEHNLEFGEVTAFHKTVSLAYYELLGDASWINREGDLYRKITLADLQERARALFQPQKASVIYYKAQENDDINQS